MFQHNKVIEFTSFQAKILSVLHEQNKVYANVYVIESDKNLKLDVPNKEVANQLEMHLSGRGYVSVKLETSVDGTITGEVLSFHPCDPTITFDDVEESFREAFRDTSVQDFLLSERGLG